ncbi:MAG: histidine ammonia-lyase [Planctomycetota bacterium]|nr:MAG: histidine ammonia-lyase [Planctomycetota bacterium]
MSSPTVTLTGDPLTIEQVEAVARRGSSVALGPAARARVESSRAALEGATARGLTLYGVNTGFGSLARARIADDDLREVQRNLLRSHAAGVGEPLPTDTVRAMLLLLAASLSRGRSGVRPVVVERVIDLLNAHVTPVVPSVGSVGASGDLAPLAHAALVLIGEGEARPSTGGAAVPGAEALRAAGLEPIALAAKEGLALINGTHLMAARAALVLADLDRVLAAAHSAAAMSIDACRGTDAFLDERVHEARGQAGQIESAARLAALIEGSRIVPSHLHNDPRVQDPYSLRCAPVALGAAMDQIAHTRAVVERELGAVTDNPLVFDDAGDGGRLVVSAGNFHGMPLAVALDALTIAVAPIAAFAERRVYYILAASDSENPLNPHLSPRPGLHSGLMIAQYTAAACVNEIATLAAPASVVNVPTSAGMEDVNSFGPRSAAQARRAVDLCTTVVAIELLCAAEALEYQRPLRSGDGVEAAHAVVRSAVPRLTADRPPGPDIEAIAGLIRDGRFSG